jgi:CDP-diacylglycerol--serine O-phosphatidyltransferase
MSEPSPTPGSAAATRTPAPAAGPSPPAPGTPSAAAEKHERRRRGIYLLPNLFTTAALFAGFYAVLSANAGRFEAAALAIFAAMILDGFDGRIARMTHTQTDFGAEYDSLSDMVAFGVAPALVAYEWALSGLGKLGWLAAFVYTAGAALRLARFNTQIGIADKRYFQGLPSPAAAAIIAGSVWIGVDNGIAGGSVGLLVALFTTGAGLLMVSNFRYHSFKLLDLHGQVPFVVLVVAMLGFALVVLDPPIVLFLLFLGYALSGPVLTLVQRRRRRGRRRREGAAGAERSS